MRYLSKMMFMTIIVALTISCTHIKKVESDIKEGVIDLSNIDLNSSIVPLKGEWSFSFNDEADNKITQSENVPGLWKIPDGYSTKNGTYKLTLKNLRCIEPVIKINRISTFYKVFVDDKVVYESGKKDGVVFFSNTVLRLPDDVENMTISIEVDQLQDTRGGGIIETPVLGSSKTIDKTTDINLAIELFVASVSFIIGLYHFMVFSSRRKDKSLLYFGLVLLTISFRTLIIGEKYILDIFRVIPWDVYLKTEMISVYFLAIMLSLYIFSILQPSSFRWIWYLFNYYVVLVIFLNIISPAPYFINIMYFFYIPSFFMLLYGLVSLIKDNKKLHKNAVIFISGFILIILSLANDTLYSLGFIQTCLLSHWATLLFMGCQSYFLSRKFSKSIEDAEKYSLMLTKTQKEQQLINSRLDDMVKLRTEQLENQIKENERMQSELLQVKKIESISVLAGGLSDELQKKTENIIKNLEKLNISDYDKSYLDNIKSSIDNISNLTYQLRLFSSSEIPDFKPLCVNDILINCTDLLLKNTGIDYKLDLPTERIYCLADKLMFNTMISNIITNALEVTKIHGYIEIALFKGIEKDENKFFISIKDYGPGIYEENLGKIFDPFYSTKPNAKGLGLSAAYSIIKKHNGDIKVSSISGKGCVFTLSMELIHPDKQELMGYSGETTGYILVIDDEQNILTLLKRMIISMGYIPLTAKDGKDGISVYNDFYKLGERVICVIIDLVLPGDMDGKDIVRKILEINQKANCIISSGMKNDPAIINPEAYGFKGTLNKPYTINDFDDMIKSMIQKKKSAFV